MRKIAIFGSREYTNKVGLQRILFLFGELQNADDLITIVTGGASGIDTKAERFAIRCHFALKVFTPEMEIEANPGLPYAAACVIRDKKIVDVSDECYAFWNEFSAGTIHGIKRAYETGKPITVIGNAGQEMTREQVEARLSELGKPMPKRKAVTVPDRDLFSEQTAAAEGQG